MKFSHYKLSIEDEETKSLSLDKLFNISLHWQMVGWGITITILFHCFDIFIWKKGKQE